MKEIVIKIPDEVYKRLFTIKPMDLPARNIIAMAIRDGKVLPKGHKELIDIKELIQSFVKAEENMKGNGIIPVFDVDEIINMILSKEVIIEADKENEVEVITRGNCMICGKELIEGLFFCKECEEKAKKEED